MYKLNILVKPKPKRAYYKPGILKIIALPKRWKIWKIRRKIIAHPCVGRKNNSASMRWNTTKNNIFALEEIRNRDILNTGN